jgi:uncharacterized protein (TIGR03382 family)
MRHHAVFGPIRRFQVPAQDCVWVTAGPQLGSHVANVGPRGENRVMGWLADRSPSGPDGWSAAGWSAFALLLAGLLGALALPGTRPQRFTAFDPSDFLRVQWLVLATLLVYPVYLAARSHWLAALPLVVIVSAESWYVVNTGLDALHEVDLAAPVSDGLLYALVTSQTALLAWAGLLGGWQSFRRRRWLRRMRRLVPELAAPGHAGTQSSIAGPDGRFSTG